MTIKRILLTLPAVVAACCRLQLDYESVRAGEPPVPPIAVDPADFPLETPVSTAPAHGFVAAASGARGLALLAPGFFEYEWTSRGELLVTLLRAVGELSRGDLSTRPGHAGWPTSTPLAQCPGRTRVELAIEIGRAHV